MIGEIYDEYVGGNFTPQNIISDNELAFLNATRAKFQPELNENFKYQVFFEISFIFGNIHSPNLNELYQEKFPNAFIILENI